MTEEQKMLAGEPYSSRDPELIEQYHLSRALLKEFHALDSRDLARRTRVLGKLFRHLGDGAWLEAPFACEYGRYISIGRNTFVNVNCVFADNNFITIGDDTLIGPAVQIYTAGHPLLPEERASPPGSASPYVTTGKPVSIGNQCWIGGGAIILPGVTIGDGCTIGAGSVVTKSIPSRSVAAGNPCRILKTLP
ncbi:sugar O-acetyltransferase [Luteolibacter arcticus]|uniref:sugar O-acetyltransferase n=1 Tax=Luteolibacter arcticus TaxID=1581411 RepID=UPI0029CAC4C6|nr:sugar O-acetyltransferase [Luteolibacter arcticus]